jgi:hypothetical protein
MARSGHGSNRGKRKPEAAKPKPAAQTSPFEHGRGVGGRKRALKKKGR